MMKYMKLIAVVCAAAWAIASIPESQAGPRKRAKDKQGQTVRKTPYEKLFDGKKHTTAVGELVTLHKIDSKVFLEIPLESMDRDMLLGTTPASTMYVRGCVAGLRQRDPLHIAFNLVDSTVVLVRRNDVWQREGVSERVGAAVATAGCDNVMGQYRIKACNDDGTAVVVDITDIFCTDIPELSPIGEGYDPFDVTATMKTNLTRVTDVRDINGELYVHTSAQYTISEWRFIFPVVAMLPVDVDVVFSLVPMPAKTMRPRLADDRIGLFTVEKKVLSEVGGPVGEVKYAARWNIVPADTAAYLRGELTDPVRPITMYMDPNMPETWREPVKRGILSWNRAFEKAGFREVIRVSDFPEDDPEFNPYGINTSCVWYAPSNIENAEGHFWADPRTGEIRSATMVLHQHVASKINRWRFVQTAQIDPRVRNVVMPRDVMDESLAYVAAHEMGHCLGLTHNMAGSSAIPVDSLRSAAFTRKYGTTASIMDYARFNYVAQPGDEGVRLTPPDVGVYDEYAIAWLYRFVPDAEAEKSVLDAWIARHAGDPMYRYAELQEAAYNRFDPSAAEEDLGDDAIRAGEYGIRNLKYIMDNLPSWIGPENDPDGAYRKSVETKLLKQYQLYLETVWSNVGGIYVYNRGESPDGARYKCVPREVQKRSVEWVFRQLLDCEQFQNPAVYEKFTINVPSPLKAQNLIQSNMGLSFQMVSYTNVLSDDPYTMEELFDDIYENAWKNSIENRKLTAADKLLQRNLLKSSDMRVAGVGGTRMLSSDNGFGDFPGAVGGVAPDAGAPLRSYVQAIIPSATQRLYATADEHTLAMLKKLQALLQKRVADAADPADVPFYRAQLFSVNKLLKPKK